ncbi:iron complex transport system permease protein [Paenibacillus sp. UNCCL117]|uniref:FecCD family ABC transporter permease n=1 Tax=unclassified Paenibacillus TaxID=185978 RepID=UPI00088092BD|nr:MULTISPECIES: iron ABC transporter permease [unclassified Paenibacillus]SDE29675.1 iron complex transport system permease protein [Paenibacillus sp. cl123]SFW63224.1 iron complex transport system permease protein [Paenibacillus sp. UNCCL117]
MSSLPYLESNTERRKLIRALFVFAILAGLIVIAFVISMNTGFIRLSPVEVIKTLFGAGTAKQNLILFEFRLPRIVISILIGAGLAVSGCILQGLTRNALADPGILGINAGAGLMVVLFIAFFPMNQSPPIFFLPFLALLGAGATAALIFALSYEKDKGISPTRMVLSGIAVAAGISAAMIILTIRLEPNQYQFVATWLAGSIWGTSWKFVVALLPWVIVLLPFVLYKARTLNVMNMGDMTAIGLGTRVSRERLLLLSAAVALAGSCVAAGGAIGFVGLIGPHLARQLVGPRHQYLLPASALVGSLLLIVSDLVARVLLQPSEIPTGIVVAVIGAPYFLYLLARSKA